MPSTFYYGLSGIALPYSKKLFPPEFQDRSRLEYYAALFNSLEVNSSFYKLPQKATVAKWAAAVHDDFRFTFKLSKEITHVKQLAFNPEGIEKFFEAIRPAAEKKGCLLIQFPPSLTIEYLNQLQELLSEISYHNTEVWKPAVEFRHRSWYEKEVAEILDEHKACMVLQDLPASATPQEFISGDTVYLRFHGPAGGYRGCYEDKVLEQKSAEIKDRLKEGKEVYCYFNNTMGDACANALMISTMVNEKR